MAMQDRVETSLWARRAEAAESARNLGIEGAGTNLKEAITGADLVILSVPVGAMESLIGMALEEGLDSSSLVTDVGSVKGVVHRRPGAILKQRGIPFIGGHPMAGSEQRGVEASKKDLFSGAMCFLTDDDQIGEPWAGKLEAFWSGLDCRICWTDSKMHDDLVARISHFPHVIAAAAAMVSLKDPSDARFGGGGLRDTTRVAGGDPSMWSEILLENRNAVSHSVSQAIEALIEIRKSLEQGDHQSIQSWLERANRLHSMSRNPETSPEIS